MTIRTGGNSRASREAEERKAKCDPRRAAAWMLAAFGMLFAGLVSGTLLYAWRRDLGWIAPALCFGGYILAFRRAMLFWDCDIDRSWRDYFWIPKPRARVSADPTASLKVVR